jgi:NAD(P)-dependent dehydrogenase (short-subunit alcohol dehydrogenase family)
MCVCVCVRACVCVCVCVRACGQAAHPHTNMAKAALNMMTRTSAQEYSAVGIYMNSVDTGWINDENPAHIAARLASEHGTHGFATPLDEVDAAARILDPVFVGAKEGLRSAGLFFKDYGPTEW